MKPVEEKLESEITHLLNLHKENIKNGSLKKQIHNNENENGIGMEGLVLSEVSAEEGAKKTTQNPAAIDPLEYYNMMKENAAAKKAKKLKLDEDEEEEEGEGEEVDENGGYEGGKRMITYEMSKNKGLIRSRRKELKNPRVKHKMKFKKAVVKRKSVVREVQRETTRYGGETTGITKSLSRGTKIK